MNGVTFYSQFFKYDTGPNFSPNSFSTKIQRFVDLFAVLNCHSIKLSLEIRDHCQSWAINFWLNLPLRVQKDGTPHLPQKHFFCQIFCQCCVRKSKKNISHFGFWP